MEVEGEREKRGISLRSKEDREGAFLLARW